MNVTVVTGIGAAGEATVAEALGNAPELRLVRRCPDVADLLAVCAAARADVAVVAPDFTGLDRTVLGQLRAAGVGIVGVHRPGDEEQQRVLQQWGVVTLLPIGAEVRDLAAAVRSAVPASAHSTEEADSLPAEAHSPADLDHELAALTSGSAGAPYVPANPFIGDQPTPQAPDGSGAGRVVTVWGPGGAPGRTTVAVNLAAEAARSGVPVVLVDADTYGAAVAQHLALLDEAPGVAAATRLADSGHLDLHSLAAVAPEVSPGFRVLTGLPRTERWPELREDALTAVLDQCRRLAALVVIDVAAPLEEDEELSYDTTAPRRNAATLAALRAATTVLAVGAADPVGLQRLVRGLDELRSVTADQPVVVANKVRSGAVGSSPARRVAEALQRFAGVSRLTLVPDDRDATDAALLAGQVLAQQASSSPTRRAIAELAAELSGAPTVPTRRARFAGRR
ncbi:AAA family ATPase [Flexivirga meconopsidis]|uniref:AAA family ATPase n=1 Tax=Flexivirga meconopsidis TaxID=2977121 RepID=UPI00223F2833|nr:hypothetical protein [Flexivirga meconopsidis]